MTPTLDVRISTALPQVNGIKYGDLLQGMNNYYVYVRLDQPGDPRWFLAKLTTDTVEAATARELRRALSTAVKRMSSTGARPSSLS